MLSNHLSISADIALPFVSDNLPNRGLLVRKMTLANWDNNKIANFVQRLENEYPLLVNRNFSDWSTDKQNYEIIYILNKVAYELDLKKQ